MACISWGFWISLAACSAPHVTFQAPYDGPDANATPMLSAAAIPLRIAVNDEATLSFTIVGLPDSIVTWTINSSGGSFRPSSSTVALNSLGLAVITVEYIAPAIGGHLIHDLQVGYSDASSHNMFDVDVVVPQDVGQYNSFPDNAGLAISANSLYGQTIAITHTVVVMRLALISDGAGFHGRMALYNDVNGKPGVLVASSGLVTIINGTNEISVNSLVEIPNGMYWLMGDFDNSAPIRRSAINSIPQAFIALPTNMPLPSNISAATTTSNGVLNFYALVAD